MKCAAQNAATETARDLHGRTEASAKQRTARRHKFQPLMNAHEGKTMVEKQWHHPYLTLKPSLLDDVFGKSDRWT